MPRGRMTARVASDRPMRDLALLEETPPALPPAVVTILMLARRAATKYLAGKHGLALEHDAQAIMEAWDTLPDAIRELL